MTKHSVTVSRKLRLPVEAGVDVIVGVVAATGLGAALCPRVALTEGNAVVHTESCNIHSSASHELVKTTLLPSDKYTKRMVVPFNYISLYESLLRP